MAEWALSSNSSSLIMLAEVPSAGGSHLRCRSPLSARRPPLAAATNPPADTRLPTTPAPQAVAPGLADAFFDPAWTATVFALSGAGRAWGQWGPPRARRRSSAAAPPPALLLGTLPMLPPLQTPCGT